MTSMARTERNALCDLALRLGEDQPTLSGDWTVKDMVVHLLVREGSPAAVGISVPLLSGATDRASRRVGRRDFAELVERLRKGPPAYSPYGWGELEKILNTLEYFVHHEDLRRAQPSWEPRQLSAREESSLWKPICVLGKALVRGANSGVVIERSDTGERATLKRGKTSVVVLGLPSEVSLFVFGRKDQARVELHGTAAGTTDLHATPLGL